VTFVAYREEVMQQSYNHPQPYYLFIYGWETYFEGLGSRIPDTTRIDLRKLIESLIPDIARIDLQRPILSALDT
jgi:hypothetical protein